MRDGGIMINNEDLTYPLARSRSFAYVTDTIYDPEIIPYLKGCDMIYHEATYLDNLRVQARERMHATAREAALIATQANVKKLIIGHYSSRYRDLNPLLEEARATMPEAHLAIEGHTYDIG